MITFGVIGFGYWGPNLVRNFTISGQSKVAVIADRDVAPSIGSCRPSLDARATGLPRPTCPE
jgi:hypothetical protein